MIDWGALVVPAAILLVIPVAIIAGFGRASGAIAVTGALATATFAAFWLVLGGVTNIFRNNPANSIALYGGVLLTLATWVLSINAAAQSRRWVWVAGLLVAGYLTLAAIYASASLVTCFPDPDGEFGCASPDALRQALIFVGYLACPVTALVYSVRPSWRRDRALPDGLTVSSLRDEATPHLAESADAD
jgi:hypothetical protein